MKKIVVVLLLTVSMMAFGAITAVTENGDLVVLREDGTWLYSETQSDEIEEIQRNSQAFKKGSKSTFNLKSKITQSSFWIDSKEWSFSLGEDKMSPTEYTFYVAGSDLYGMVISEAVQIKPEELVKIAVENARSVAPDIRVLSKEYRNVNGNDVIHMVMRGTIQSIDFTYVGYYHSNEAGSTQFLTYTGTNLLSKYEDKIYSLLNGFDVSK